MKITTTVGLVLLLICTACNRVSSEGAVSNNRTPSSNSSAPIAGTNNKEMGKVRDIAARLVPMSPAKVETVLVGTNDSLLNIYFLDESHGWVTGTRNLYKTADGGTSWSEVQIPFPSKATLLDLFFLNRSLGWLLAHECNSDQRCEQDHFWVMHTADGGASWQLQYEGQESVGYQIRFYDEQNGWLIGANYKHPGSPFSPLVLHTSDEGHHWNDVSEGINVLLAQDKDKIRSPTHDVAMEMIASSAVSLTLATGNLRLFRTEDGGQSWTQIGYFHDEPDQTGVRQFGKESDRVFLVGGAASLEGSWGMVAREQEDNSWERLRLRGVSFSKVLFLEGHQILACGSIPTDTASPGKRFNLDGVILYSKDGGKTWGIMYRNPQVESIKSLTTNSGKIWAVGDHGLVLRFDVPKAFN